LGKVDMIVADPPYFETKGRFDFIWDSFGDYLRDVAEWVRACVPMLADSGTLFWFGDDKKIAHSQVILDEHLNLLNSLVWNKGSFMGLEASAALRCFAPCTERILMYERKNDCEAGFEPSYIRDHFQNYLMAERENAGLSTRDINRICGYSTNTRNKIINREKNWMFITEGSYNKLRSQTGFFQTPYSELREQYEQLRRPFDNTDHLQEILNFGNEATASAVIDHATVKPLGLIRTLIKTCSRPRGTILDPFMGSGTTLRAAKDLGRQAIGIEIEERYVEIAIKRLRQEVLGL